MPNLLELGVTRHQEHVACNAIVQHLLTRNAIITQSQEDPANIGLNLNVVQLPKAHEQFHNSLVDQNFD